MKATILVGNVIRELRKQRKFSQEQLALKAKLTTSYIGMLERGLKSPTVDTLEKISYALEINIEELFLGTNQSKSNSYLKKISDKIEDLPEPIKSKFIEAIFNLVLLVK